MNKCENCGQLVRSIDDDKTISNNEKTTTIDEKPHCSYTSSSSVRKISGSLSTNSSLVSSFILYFESWLN